LASAEDIVPPQSALQRFVVGQEQTEEDKKRLALGRPYGMALWKGKLYVCDSGGGKGAIFDFERREYRTFGRQKREKTHLEAPVNVSIATNGQKFVTDPKLGQVLVYDANDQLARTVELPEGTKPCDAVWHEGELFVACLKSNSILVLDPRSGRVLRRVGKAGSNPGEFVWPTNLAFGPEGDLYVCDTLNARVQAFNREGKVAKVVGSRGLALGKMVRPKGIAVDRAGRLYVADAATDSVQIFNPAGRLLLMLGRAGTNPGDMSLPAKVTISYDGIEYFADRASPDFKIEYLVFVSNQLGPNKINVYGFGAYLGAVPETTRQDRPDASSANRRK